MALMLITIGLVFVVTAINGTFTDLFGQLKTDLSGAFLNWVLAVIIVGSIGYIPGLERPSRLFLALIIIALILANGGLFDQLTAAFQQGPQEDAGGTPLANVNTTTQSANPASLAALNAATGAIVGANLPTSPGVTAGAPIGKVSTNPTTGLGIGGV